MQPLMTEKIFLDPDYRREPPTSGSFCCRCQKPIVDIATAVRVTESYEKAPFVAGDPEGKSLVGYDCWKQIFRAHMLRSKR